jgi:hypothetical protein
MGDEVYDSSSNVSEWRSLRENQETKEEGQGMSCKVDTYSLRDPVPRSSSSILLRCNRACSCTR